MKKENDQIFDKDFDLDLDMPGLDDEPRADIETGRKWNTSPRPSTSVRHEKQMDMFISGDEPRKPAKKEKTPPIDPKRVQQLEVRVAVLEKKMNQVVKFLRSLSASYGQ